MKELLRFKGWLLLLSYWGGDFRLYSTIPFRPPKVADEPDPRPAILARRIRFGPRTVDDRFDDELIRLDNQGVPVNEVLVALLEFLHLYH